VEVLHHRASDFVWGGVKVGGEVDGTPGRLAEGGGQLERFRGLARAEGGGEAFDFIVGILIDRDELQAGGGEGAGLGEGEGSLGELGVIAGDELDAGGEDLRGVWGAVGAGVESGAERFGGGDETA
jgi:hypothetical protein